MASFACKSRDSSGSVVEKTIHASSKREVLALLEKSGLTAIAVMEVLDSRNTGARATGKTGAAHDSRAAATAAGKRPRGRRLKTKELMQFSLQLSSALSSGVPILTGLRWMQKQTKNEAFKTTLEEMITDLEGGLPLSEAMARHPRSFPPAYVGTIAAGEMSSTLDDMLENLAEYLEAEMEMRSDVRSALMYPIIVISTLSIAITVLIVFIVPRFAAFYDGFHAELPLATRILVGGSGFVSTNALALSVACAGLIFGCLRLIRVPRVREAIDRTLLRIPLVGKMIHTASTLHAVQMMGLFTRAGVPLLESLRSISKTVTNTKYRADLVAVTNGVAVGDSLTDGMEAVGCFPDAARQMLANGEATGTMERACFAVARHYKKELRYLTKNTATFIEPLLTLVLAVIVLFVALAAFLPMWDMVKIIGK